jgi:hypothetical protein
VPRYGFTDSYPNQAPSFFPREAGRFSAIGLTKGLKPMERHQEDLTLVSNLTNLGVGNPHGGSGGYLNCGSYREHEAAISCDQLAARTIGKDARFTSLVLTGREPIPGQGAGHGGFPAAAVSHALRPERRFSRATAPAPR